MFISQTLNHIAQRDCVNCKNIKSCLFEVLYIIPDSSFVCQLRDNSVYECLEDHELTADAVAAGIVFDKKVRLGSNNKTIQQLSVPVRLIAIKWTPHKKRYKTGRGGAELDCACPQLLKSSPESKRFPPIF
jgi:hypothetical protein